MMRRALIAAAVVFAAATAARASVFHVTNLDDDGTGSLRWAVDQANHSGGADQIVFDVAGTIHSDRKSTRLNSSHVAISYAVFCLKKKKKNKTLNKSKT